MKVLDGTPLDLPSVHGVYQHGGNVSLLDSRLIHSTVRPKRAIEAVDGSLEQANELFMSFD